LIDTLVLGCTHYPLLEDKIKSYLPDSVNILSQGKYVADGLKDYLKRHPEIDERCSKNSSCRFLTTESPEKFSDMASVFLNVSVDAKRIILG
jgi:glutamate racemase